MKITYTPVCPQCKSIGTTLYFPYSATLYECKNKHGWFIIEDRESIVKTDELEKIKKYLNQ